MYIRSFCLFCLLAFIIDVALLCYLCSLFPSYVCIQYYGYIFFPAACLSPLIPCFPSFPSLTCTCFSHVIHEVRSMLLLLQCVLFDHDNISFLLWLIFFRSMVSAFVRALSRSLSFAFLPLSLTHSCLSLSFLWPLSFPCLYIRLFLSLSLSLFLFHTL